MYLINIYVFFMFPELNSDFTKYKIPIPWHLLGKKVIPLHN